MGGRGAIGDWQGLTAALGFRPGRADLLEEALTHPSAGTPARSHNQRLEFLGDRVLGLVIAEALIETFPDADEGALAPRFNSLVRRETLAEIAREIGLGQHLRLGRSESISGGRRKAAILADALEAVIAAVYREAGYAEARAVILRLWGARIKAAGEAEADAKTRLQEWAQGRGIPPPSYTEIGRSGPDHKPVFRVRARLETGAEATGEARSKKLAEQAAAAALLASVEDSP